MVLAAPCGGVSISSRYCWFCAAARPATSSTHSAVWFWMSRVERSAKAIRVEPFMPPSVDSLARELDEYAAAGNAYTGEGFVGEGYDEDFLAHISASLAKLV